MIPKQRKKIDLASTEFVVRVAALLTERSIILFGSRPFAGLRNSNYSLISRIKIYLDVHQVSKFQQAPISMLDLMRKI